MFGTDLKIFEVCDILRSLLYPLALLVISEYIPSHTIERIYSLAIFRRGEYGPLTSVAVNQGLERLQNGELDPFRLFGILRTTSVDSNQGQQQ